MTNKSHQLPVLSKPSSKGALLVRTYKVGELAKVTRKTVRALHLYEEKGLLEPVDRSPGGYRLYGERAVQRVRWIAKMQEMGYSLTNLQAIASQWESSQSAPATMAEVGHALRGKLADTRAQIARLMVLADELEASVEYLETCPSCDASTELSGCQACEMHEDGRSAPELVAGFQSTVVRANNGEIEFSVGMRTDS